MDYLSFPGGIRLHLDTGTFTHKAATPKSFMFSWRPDAKEYLDIVLPVLTRVYRWSASVDWTVLQHSVLVLGLAKRARAPRATLAACAAHDLHEAWVGDVPTPTKRYFRSRGLLLLDDLHRRVEAHRDEALGFSVNAAFVRPFDERAGQIEALVFGLDAWEDAAPVTDAERAVFTAVQRTPTNDLMNLIREAVS